MSEGCQTRRMYGHNYAKQGTYEVTIAVAGRQPVFGQVQGTTKVGGEAPHLVPSALGQAVLNDEIPKIHYYYPMVEVWQVCLMPDHIHLIVRINEPLPEGKHLGIIIGAFKGGISRAWWRLSAPQSPATVTAPQSPATVTAASAAVPAAVPVPQSPATVPAASAAVPATVPATVPAASAAVPAAVPATVTAASAAGSRPPLFEPNYNDHILMRDGQLDNWKRYLLDNPRRYMMRREYPDLFQRTLCITIDGVRYSAFGNMLLLRQPEKQQVFFHRHTNGKPTEDTDYWKEESRRLLNAANSGDVLVTPGISECEKRIKNAALQQRLRLIHLQKEPIGNYWKPERRRFEACANGTLLILAPWHEDMPAFVSDYERFHYLNRLTEAVCAVSHTTEVAVQGLRHVHGG